MDEVQQSDETYDSEKEDKLNLLEQFIQELNDFDKALMLLYLEGKKHGKMKR